MVSPEYRREIRGVLLLSLFIMVVPLVFFPKDFGLRVDMPFSLLSAFELGWYMVILFIVFSKASVLWVLFCALLVLLYRFFVGIGFGLFLVAMFSLDLSFSLKSGICQYLPSLLLQAMMSPFILKSSFELLMRRAGRQRKILEIPKEMTPEGSSVFSTLQMSKSGENQMKVTSFAEEKSRTKGADLESALHYLREYSGVKGAILVDPEGLVVACDRLPDLDPETFASLALSLKQANNSLLKRITENGLERVGIHTPDLWISLNQILSLTLVTVADRNTDELLSVRISQATVMIRRYLEQRYTQEILKGVEDRNV
jgi:predicted regulator of Ras-like GTPase activity (Roadblock/LC7/MglB family)